MDEKQKKLAALLSDILPHETSLATPVAGLGLFRIDRSFPRSPFSYDAVIFILAQGEKRAYLGDDVYTYDPSRYLVLPVPLPVDCEGIAEPGAPILGLTITIDPIEVGEILLDMEDAPKEPRSLPRGIYGAAMTEALYDATLRLVQAIAGAQDAKVLAPMIKREIIYRVLQGEKGGDPSGPRPPQQAFFPDREGAAEDPRVVQRRFRHRKTGERAGHEQLHVSQQLQGGDGHLPPAVHQERPPAQGADADDPGRAQRQHGRAAGGIRKPLAVQQGVQAPLRRHPGPGCDNPPRA
jgi:hypothetical protein